jgi:peptidoglycan/LPS O-acetylase OafA/YrhL
LRSSSGAYFVNLDHLRALAALLVFQWHFIHAPYPYGAPGVAFEYAPSIFPFAIVDEGHAGVSLFMCLSGYLFVKLLDGKKFDYWRFLWNRFIRLAPLLAVVIIIVGLQAPDLTAYAIQIVRGAVGPTLPNGGWSITVEAHFYVVLPLILWLLRVRLSYVALIVVVAILLRTGIYFYRGQVQSLAYWTLIGRIDQFVLGILAYKFGQHLRRRHITMLTLFVLFATFYWWFDARGGFYRFPSYPSPSPVWIVMPAIEGVFFAALIAYYDQSFRFKETRASWLVAQVGICSYSIYLTHFFYVFWMGEAYASFVGTHNFYVMFAGGLLCFCVAALISSASYYAIEFQFLKFRTKYVMPDTPMSTA